MDGKRWNGKGKEYDTIWSKLQFDGIYLNGEKTGIFKKYYSRTGNLQFEYELLNGKRNGSFKQYNFLEKIEFEGEYLNGNFIGEKKI